jgi:hypothetical protein
MAQNSLLAEVDMPNLCGIFKTVPENEHHFQTSGGYLNTISQHGIIYTHTKCIAVYLLESMPQFSKTLGSTIPQPRISNHPVPFEKRLSCSVAVLNRYPSQHLAL